MIGTLHIDDLDGAVTLFKSTDEGTETIAVFDEEHREVIQDLLAEVERLRGLLDEIDDVVYYNDKKAGQVLPVEKPNLELLRDIMMSYTDEAYQIRGDEGECIE